MTLTESITAIRNHLRETPEDRLAWSALADALEELGDPTAVGYRALVANGLYPNNWERYHGDGSNDWWWIQKSRADSVQNSLESELLPDDWFKEISKNHATRLGYTNHFNFKLSAINHRDFNLLVEVTTFAFTQLPPERQAELLRGGCP